MVPLTSNSNAKACLQILKTLWMEKAQAASFPSNLEPVARKFVAECGASPLALRIIANMLDGAQKPKKWQNLLDELRTLCLYPSFRRSSISTLDEEELPRLLFVYQLSASKLPGALQSLIPVLTLFPCAKWVPVSALLYVYMYSTGRDLTESCTIIRAMCKASFLDLEDPDGRFLTACFSYHAVLQNFVSLSSDFNVVQLPSQLNENSSLALAAAKLYAQPSYQEQAIHVFSRYCIGEETVIWSHKNDPGFWTSKPWLLVLELIQSSTFKNPASRLILSACQEAIIEKEFGQILSQLFGNPASLYIAAAIFSDLVKQGVDEDALAGIAEQLENNQAVLRLVMRLRELLSFESARQNPAGSSFAEETAFFAWALADLVQYSSLNVVVKLRSEPLISDLEDYEDGIARPAFHRLEDLLGY